MNARPRRAALLAALIGVAGLSGGLWLDVPRFAPAYLAALVAWSAVPVGALALVAIAQLTGGPWAAPLAPALHAAARTLPLTAALFVPVLLALPALYPWTGEVEPRQPLYLNQGFFILRSVVYFALWIGFARVLLRPDRPLGERVRPRTPAALALIVYMLTASLAGVDWVMSLHPQFVSSVFGLLFVTHQLLAALAFAVVVTLLFARRPAPYDELGDLLLAGVLIWAFLSFTQYLIVWSMDLPREIGWYLIRFEPPWLGVLYAVILLHGIVPFFGLLSARERASRAMVAGIALSVFLMRFAESAWWVLPAYAPAVLPGALLGGAALAGVGGLWLAAFLLGWDRGTAGGEGPQAERKSRASELMQ